MLLLRPGEKLTIQINDIAFGGDGVGHAPDGRAIFVPFTAAGETVEIEITHVYKRHAKGKVVTICEPSAHRIEPPCPYFQHCGGCQYQHLDYPAQVEVKTSQLTASLTRIGRFSDVPAPDPVVPSPHPYGYRNKLVLEPVGGRDRQVVDYGFCHVDNKTFIPVEQCLLASDALNDLLHRLRSVFEGQELRPHKLTMRETASGEVRYFFGHGSHQAELLTERIGDKTVHVPLPGFWQVNPEVAEKLVGTASAWVRDLQPSCFIDAYAGVGLFSLTAGAEVPYGIVIERHPASLNTAQRNHKDWHSPKRKFVADSTENAIPRELSKATAERRAGTLVLLDPPRTGCADEVLDALRKTPVASVVYISCNPTTLARDLKALCQDGPYTLERTALFDMFPQTAHFETAVLLTADVETA